MALGGQRNESSGRGSNVPPSRERFSTPPPGDAPSPSSSKGSDLELPDAFHQSSENSGRSYRNSGGATASAPSSSAAGMDLDSRITSFLAGGSGPGLVIFILTATGMKVSCYWFVFV